MNNQFQSENDRYGASNLKFGKPDRTDRVHAWYTIHKCFVNMFDVFHELEFLLYQQENMSE